MRIVDEDGFLFGHINVIDALVLIVLVIGALAGYSVLTPPDQSESRPSLQITFETAPQPKYVVDAISEGPVSAPDVIAVERKTVRPSEEGYVVRLRVLLPISESYEGLPRYRNERLFIGRHLELDLGRTIVEGVVVAMGPEEP